MSGDVINHHKCRLFILDTEFLTSVWSHWPLVLSIYHFFLAMYPNVCSPLPALHNTYNSLSTLTLRAQHYQGSSQAFEVRWQHYSFISDLLWPIHLPGPTTPFCMGATTSSTHVDLSHPSGQKQWLSSKKNMTTFSFWDYWPCRSKH